MADLARKIACWWMLFSIVLINLLSSVTKLFFTAIFITHFFSVGVENALIYPTKITTDVPINGSCYPCDKTVPAQPSQVPVLKETLAWLWNRNQCDKLVSKKLKAELIDSLLIAI